MPVGSRIPPPPCGTRFICSKASKRRRRPSISSFGRKPGRGAARCWRPWERRRPAMLLDYAVTDPSDGQTEIPVPYDVRAEEAVLGSLLLDRDAVIQAATFLQPGHFYRDQNG